jgi:hypothetical protein
MRIFPFEACFYGHYIPVAYALVAGGAEVVDDLCDEFEIDRRLIGVVVGRRVFGVNAC